MGIKCHRKQKKNTSFHTGDTVAAVCIARLTSVGMFDDDGGKTQQGGKKQRGKHKTGGAIATNYIKMRHKPSDKITK